RVTLSGPGRRAGLALRGVPDARIPRTDQPRPAGAPEGPHPAARARVRRERRGTPPGRGHRTSSPPGGLSALRTMARAPGATRRARGDELRPLGTITRGDGGPCTPPGVDERSVDRNPADDRPGPVPPGPIGGHPAPVRRAGRTPRRARSGCGDRPAGPLTPVA